MALNKIEIEYISSAINQYRFPSVTFDFVSHREVQHHDMKDVEIVIRTLLMSADPCELKHGLANVFGAMPKSGTAEKG